MEAVYFESADEFECWMEENHQSAPEILVGFHKRGTGKPTLTWPESVDVALCFGWIDGIRRRVDDARYTIRFTPRRPRSCWSRVNLDRVESLIAEGRMRRAGLRAYEARDPKGFYSYEDRPHELAEPYVSIFQEHTSAWTFFAAQPKSYRRWAAHHITSAKQEETRQRRLAKVIEYSSRGERVQ